METGKSLQTDLKELNRSNPTSRRYRTAKSREMNFRKVGKLYPEPEKKSKKIKRTL
jgi:hypothetical protein